MRQAASVLVLVLAVAGCATGGATSTSAPRSADSGTGRESAADTIAQLQRQAAMAQAEITLLRQNLAALRVEVERLSAAAERTMPSPSPPTIPSSGPGRFESADLEPVRVEPPLSPTQIEPEVVQVTPSGVKSRAVQSTASVTATAAVPLAGQSIYDRGYTLYHQGRYVDAESSFQRFLQAHGGTELADNAQFWIGQSRFARADHMGALLAFQEVLDRYPTGNKVADSLLRVGDCLTHLDNSDGARQRFEEVIRRFPGSAAAAMAEERLGRPGS